MIGESGSFHRRGDELDRCATFVDEVSTATSFAPGPSPALIIYGRGGIGKTRLLSECRKIAMSRKVAICSIDWDVERDRDQFSFEYENCRLDMVVERIRTAVTAQYRDVLVAVAGELRAIDTALGNLSPSNVRAGRSDQPDSEQSDPSDAVFQGTYAFESRQAMTEKVRRERALAEAVAALLNACSRTRPMIVFLDTSEIVVPILPRLLEMFATSGGRVGWALALRAEENQLVESDPTIDLVRRQLAEGTRLIELARLSEAESRRYVEARLQHPPGDQRLERALSLARGVPLALEIVSRMLDAGDEIPKELQDAPESELVRNLTARFLVHLEKDASLGLDLLNVYALALFEDCGPDVSTKMLAALLDVPHAEVETRLERLSARYEFVIRAQRRMHQDVTAAVRAFLLAPTRRQVIAARCEAADAVLAQHLADLVQRRTLESLLRSNDWSRLTNVWLWFRTWHDQTRGLELFCELSAFASVFNPLSLTTYRRTIGWFSAASSNDARNLIQGLSLTSSTGLVDDVVSAVSSEDRYALARSRAKEELRFLRTAALTLDALGLPVRFMVSHLSAKCELREPDDRIADALESVLISTPFQDVWATELNSALAEKLAEKSVPARDLRTARLLVALDPRNASNWHSLSEASNSVEVSRVACERAASLDPTNAIFRSNLGLFLRAAGREQDALAAFSRAADLDPTNPRRHFYRGNSLARLGDHTQAITAYDQAITLDPTNPAFHFNRGNSLAQLGDHTQAITAYDQAITLDPTNPAFHSNRGYSLAQLGDHTQAITAYDQAITLDPNHAVSFANRGYALATLGEHGRAVASFDDAIRLDPSSGRRHVAKGDSLMAMDRFAEARASFAQACELSPNEVELWLKLAQSAAALRDSSATRSAVDEVVRRQPTDPTVVAGCAFLLTEAAPADARALLETAHHLSSGEERLVDRLHWATRARDHAMTARIRQAMQRALSSHASLNSRTRVDLLRETGEIERLRLLRLESPSGRVHEAICEHAYGDLNSAVAISRQLIETTPAYLGNLFEAVCAVGDWLHATFLGQEFSKRENRPPLSVQLLLQLLSMSTEAEYQPLRRKVGFNLQEDIAILVDDAIFGDAAAALQELLTYQDLDAGTAGYVRSLIAFADLPGLQHLTPIFEALRTVRTRHLEVIAAYSTSSSDPEADA